MSENQFPALPINQLKEIYNSNATSAEKMKKVKELLSPYVNKVVRFRIPLRFQEKVLHEFRSNPPKKSVFTIEFTDVGWFSMGLAKEKKKTNFAARLFDIEIYDGSVIFIFDYLYDEYGKEKRLEIVPIPLSNFRTGKNIPRKFVNDEDRARKLREFESFFQLSIGFHDFNGPDQMIEQVLEDTPSQSGGRKLRNRARKTKRNVHQRRRTKKQH